MKKLYWLSVFLGVIFLTTQSRALTLSPVRFLMTIDPGASQTAIVTITNSEKTPLTVRPIVVGVRQTAAHAPEFGTNITRAEKWVKYDDATSTIASGESRKFAFVVSAPDSGSPGSYYLAIGAERVASGGDVGLSARLLSLLTVQVSGTAVEKISIEKWSSDHFFVQKKDWPFILNLYNAGNVESAYETTVRVRDWRGNERVRLSAPKKILLSGARVSDDSIVNVDGYHLWPGMYQVETQIHYGLTGQIITATESIFYMPLWSWVALGLIGLIMVGASVSQYKFQM